MQNQQNKKYFKQLSQPDRELGILALHKPKQRDTLLSRIGDLSENVRLLRIRYRATKNTFENELIKREGIKTRKKLNRLIGQYKIKVKGKTDDKFIKKAIDNIF